MAKNFKTINPIEEILTQDHKEVKEDKEIVYIKPESKTKRVNLLIKPSTYKKLKEIANKRNTSLNDLINQLAEEEIKKEGK